MLTKMKIKLEKSSEERFSHNISSLFHGFLFEIMDKKNADVLHEEGLKSFSQYLDFRSDEIEWNVMSMNQGTHEALIHSLDSINEIDIRHKNRKFKITDRLIETTTLDELLKEHYFTDGDRFIHLAFITPTSFKSQGEYQFFPDLRLIYQSLMHKFDHVSEESKIFDEEVLQHLTEHSVITRYQLKSTLFHLERVKIPSFTGKITIKVNGPQSLVNLANLLFRFGEYSGIGIKCSLGMGAIRVEKKGEESIWKKRY